MILTVTMNSSIDKLYLMESIQPETVMRVKEVHNTAGGKGLNVSKVAAKLGEPVTAMGFIGGFNGQYLVSLINEPLVRPDFTHVAGETRCCINCWDLSNGHSTEYLEPGEPVTDEDIRRFLADFDAELPKTDVVAISGSVPQGVPEDFYCELIRRCRAAGIPVLVDTSGNRLIAAVKEKPAFIKPNEDEISQLTGRHFSSREDTIGALVELHGALLACDEGVFHGKPPKITPRNTVGCGDSMVAGFAVGFARRLPILDSFRMALAVSAANALSIFTGDFDPADYARLSREVSVERIS